MGHYYEQMEKWPQAEKSYIEAWKFRPRCESLVRIAQHYREKENWRLAWSWLKIALELEYPANARLWVEKEFWHYERYHLMGIIAYYYNKLEDGRYAIQKLIDNGRVQQQDHDNMKFYNQS